MTAELASGLVAVVVAGIVVEVVLVVVVGMTAVSAVVDDWRTAGFVA